MKFSIIAVALCVAIFGQASPIPDETAAILTNKDVADAATSKLVVSLSSDASLDHEANMGALQQVSDDFANHDKLAGNACKPGLKVSGFARIADYTVRGNDVSLPELERARACTYLRPSLY
jgi:hypothetical protein